MPEDEFDMSNFDCIRVDKLKELVKYGINPFPSEEYEVSCKITDILNNFESFENKSVKIAGRLMSRRIMGGASFCEIQDSYDRIQFFMRRQEICCDSTNTDFYDVVFKKLIDLGDIIGIEGYVFKTKTDEISIHINKFTLLAKSLKALPCVKDDGDKVHFKFSDKEQIYRKRYLDLILNKESLNVFLKRSKIINFMRKTFDSFGYLEVETPILQPIYGGASARPFVTFHNALGQKLYLRISNELYLKRLIIGGINGVYEFSKDFRNEGMDRFHNPEFTQVELYVPYKDYKWMMNFTEDLLANLTLFISDDTSITVGDNVINFKKPFERFTMFEIIERFTGVNISNMYEDELKKTARELKVDIEPSFGYGKIIDAIFGELCEHKLIQPTFITNYPVEMSPLAKNNYKNPRFVDRFELFINGKECANCFSELNDPIEQKKRFINEKELSKMGDDEAMVLDNDFLLAMSYGMPPTAGIGIGIDRLTMILTNSKSIQDVLLFPQMRNLQE